MTDSPTDASSPSSGAGPANAQERRDADVSHAARSGAMQVVTILGQGLLPLAHILIARLFGTVVFGAYQGTLAFVEMATRGGTGGADKAMLRYIAGFRGRGDASSEASALGTGLRLCVSVALPLAIGLMLGAPLLARLLHEPELATALPAMAPAVLFTALVYVLVQASLGAKVTRANFLVRGLGEPGFFLLAGLGAALISRDLRTLAIAHSTAALATLCLALIVVGRVFGARRLGAAMRAPRLSGFAGFSLPMGGSEMLNAVLQRADIVMLTAFAGARSAGIYAAAEFLCRIVANIRYAFDSIAAGVLSEAYHRNERERLRHNLALMTRWVVSVAAPMAVLAVVFRRFLLGLYGPDFAAGATAMLILAASHFINASLGLAPWLLMVSGRSRLLLVDNLACAGLNILLGLLLIPRFHIVGTAIAVLCTIAAYQGLMLWQTWRAERVHPFELRLVRPLVAAALMLAAMRLASPWLGHGAWGLLLLVGGIGFYLAVLLLLGLPPEEKTLLAKLRARLRREAPPATGC
ncbi:MAG: oligosaccharide flippase family protein [Deltaproteobacteria bacterium]|jgi:O-antigen/teichoic acid export membrane protein|nr:oligosaccharide flippase family protein [Deltaproteobacteria bacterium]